MVPAPLTAPERTPALLYFKTADANYVYDAPTNEILRVSRDFWETTHHADWWREKGLGRGSYRRRPHQTKPSWTRSARRATPDFLAIGGRNPCH